MALTNRDPDIRQESIPQAFRNFRDQFFKEVHTSIPGIVQEYDPATQRARVQPAVDLWLRDGRTIPKAIILDVPVMWPGGGGFLIHAPLAVDDAVLLLFSERDIQGFKERLERGPLPSDRIMAVQDAVAWPMFLPQATSLATDTGLTIQNEDGLIHIRVEEDRIEVVAPRFVLTTDDTTVDVTAQTDINLTATGTITITGGNVTIAGTTTVNGVRIANQPAGTQSASGPGSHTHGLTAA